MGKIRCLSEQSTATLKVENSHDWSPNLPTPRFYPETIPPRESLFQPSTLASREDDVQASMFPMFQGKRDLGKGCLFKIYQK